MSAAARDHRVFDGGMGLAKRWLEEVEARGFGEADGYLCLDNVKDDVLRDKLSLVACAEECTFCGRSADSGANFSAPMEELLTEVVSAVRYFYDDALSLPWDNEEGIYVG